MLSQPVSRIRLLLTKVAGLVIATGLIVAILILLFWIIAPFIDLDVKAGRIINAFVLLWPFEVAMVSLSVLLSLLLSNRVIAGSLMAIYIVTSYILDSLSNLISGLEPFRPLFVTRYYQGEAALGTEISWTYLAILTAIIVIALLLSLFIFVRRDIGTELRLSLPLRRGRAPVPG